MRSTLVRDHDLAMPALHRRAWITFGIGLALFLALVAVAGLAVSWFVEHATARRLGNATVISGSEALWRDSPDREWSIFDGAVEIDEGDEISTELGTVVWVTLFDGSTLEVTERSHIRFDRLRQSRFSDAAQQVRIELLRGTIYGTMAPVVDREYGELEIVTSEASLLVRGERDSPAPVSTSFLVEAQEAALAGMLPFRAAAFRGTLEIQAGSETVSLQGPEQYEIDRDGVGSLATRIRSEILANGSFIAGLAGWETIYSAEAREPAEDIGVVETLARDDHSGSPVLRIYRGPTEVWARTGVRQEVQRTLRLPSALTLSFDVMVASQGPSIDGRQTVPLAIQLNYTDILGQERMWTTVYAVRSRDGVLDADSFTTMNPGQWTHVIVDLHNLAPIPKILDTLVVYASGGEYEAFVANLSLTTGEGTTSP